MSPAADPFTPTLTCPDRSGIVRAVSGFLADQGCDVVEHQQFDDPASGRLFARTRIARTTGADLPAIAAAFAPVADAFGMDHAVHPRRDARVLVMVSTAGHCLNDLLFRWRPGGLSAEIVAIVSNHETLRPMAEGPARRSCTPP